MSVDDTLLCSFQILKPAEKKPKYAYGAGTSSRHSRCPLRPPCCSDADGLPHPSFPEPVTPPRSKKAITAGKK